ncbi:MAG TPA: sulfite exporter TauE/SafE family protein [Candidatus Humimicrobiaceae bacterium]
MLLLLYLFSIGLFAGLVGSVTGIGGGIIIVPFLSLLLKIPIHLALGTSIVAVLATSLASSIRFFKKDIINIPLGLVMEIPTTAGSIIGSVSVAYLKSDALFILFGCFAFVSGVLAFIKDRFAKDKFSSDNTSESTSSYTQNNSSRGTLDNSPVNVSDTDPSVKSSIFNSSYYDEPSKRRIYYKPRRIAFGSGVSVFAGLLSGLLGVGGGIIKVPAMNIIMDVPIKVATATSSYMIGITAVVSSVIYFYNGYINPDITIPAVIGVLIGATAGSFAAGKLKSRYIIFIILIIFSFIGILMFLRGFKILNY